MKRRRFCPGCGNTIKETQEFCLHCLPREKLEFKDVNFKFCVECGVFVYKNKWVQAETLKDAVITIAKDSIKQDVRILKVNIPNLKLAPGVNIDFSVDVQFQGVEYEIPGRTLITLCPKCSKKGTKYFEGILQIRNPSKKVLKFAEQMVDNAAHKGVRITDVKDVKNGVDFYISSKRYIRVIGKELKKNFEGELKESPQLFSRDKLASKDIFRLNVLFRVK